MIHFGDVFFKLINNAFYGKTIENVYNRQDVELVNDVDRYTKLVENISFKYSVEFDDDLVAVHKKRDNVKLDKFNYIGYVLLEKAKLFMYKAIYGKTIMNVCNRQDVELVNDVEKYINLVKNISFKYAVEMDDDLVAVHKTRSSVKVDKFNYIGFATLEKAKLFMYNAIYEYFEKELECGFHYTDTDSIFIKINVSLDSNMETEMNKIKDILHNNELGKMKDELPNDTIIEACFLKAKAYCYNTVKGEDEKKLKGITKATIKNQISIEDYSNAIYEGKTKYVTNYTIDSNKHHLETKEQYKTAIDPFDDKGSGDNNGEFRFYYVFL